MKYMIAIFGILAMLIYFDKDDTAVVSIYEKSITKIPPQCLSLLILPEHKEMQSVLEKKYDFSSSCNYRLEVTYTNNIHCNSNQNSDKKALSSFPVSFIRMEIRRGMKIEYSYYKDLTKSATPDDAEDAFDRLSSELKLKCK